jgi:hypothetical protein
MKFRAICLEVFAEMSIKEFEELGKGNVLNHILKVSSNVTGDNGHEVPMDMKVVRHQKEEVVVEQTPKDAVYFGRARNISFRVSRRFYDFVEQAGTYGQKTKDDKYKLIIRVKDR